MELRDDDRAFCLAGLPQRRGENRPAIERIGALARLDLDMLGDQIDPLRLGETLNGGALGFEP